MCPAIGHDEFTYRQRKSHYNVDIEMLFIISSITQLKKKFTLFENGD
jgi:hypothetical protein